MSHDAASATYQVKPAREEDICWAAALGHRVYHGLDVIPEPTMLEWFHANPNGFFTFWHGQERIGNFDVLPLRPAAMQCFIEGQLLERDIHTDSIVPASEASQIRDLHWESIVIDPAFKGSRSRMVKLFVLTYLDTLAHLCPIQQIGNVYAIAASKQGAGLLQRMGLSPEADASTRLDAHPLYRGTVASYHAAMARLFRANG
jgi:hypothetical protein